MVSPLFFRFRVERVAGRVSRGPGLFNAGKRGLWRGVFRFLSRIGGLRALREGSEFALNLFLLLHSMPNVTSYPQIPPFGGKASSFESCEEKAILWERISTIGPSKRVAILV